MNKSDSITKLAAALAGAQAEMPKVPFNATNPFLKNKFADLGAVIETSRPVLAKHGLSVTQLPTSDGDKIGVTTILLHNSGEWLSDTIYLATESEKGKSAAQVAGSVITYLRRYSWSAVLGLYADEDTDGHKPEQKVAEKPKTIRERYADLFERAKAAGLEGLDAYVINEKMTDAEIGKLGAELKAKVEAKEKK